MLKIKIINLADEARTIRKEVHRLGRRISAITLEHGEEAEALDSLRREQGSIFWHGYGIVREAAREAQLAYGFLRGVAYSRIENRTSEVPDWGSVKKTARRFYDGAAFETEWGVWRDQANEHLMGYMLEAA